MGLYIHVFYNLKKIESDEDDVDVFLEHRDLNSKKSRCFDLEQGGYQGEEGINFQAGSYGGYNEWRNELSVLMLGCPARYVWEHSEEYKDKPFYELIDFSDCEGYIGPSISRKLAQDFENHRRMLSNRFAMSDPEYFIEKYNLWASAFKQAAEKSGVIKFS